MKRFLLVLILCIVSSVNLFAWEGGLCGAYGFWIESYCKSNRGDRAYAMIDMRYAADMSISISVIDDKRADFLSIPKGRITTFCNGDIIYAYSDGTQLIFTSREMDKLFTLLRRGDVSLQFLRYDIVLPRWRAIN